MSGLSRILIVVGIVLVIAGVLLRVVPGANQLGRLPGDIRIERDDFRLYVPITSCILVSLVVSGVLWLWSRFS